MMLKTRIETGLKQAMKDKDAARLSTLRLINAAIKDTEIALRSDDDAQAGCLGDDQVRAILSKMIKQRRESARAYEEGGRLELAERELAEITVIEEFLPRPLSEDEQEAAIAAALSEAGASSIRDMGRVMALLKDRHAGRMDFSTVGPLVRDRLS
ncbi:MAG: GatB/YqeY domain-containing protein [Qingshengfaniella sp.]